MKNLLSVVLLLVSITFFAQEIEKKITSEVKEVTVFLDGAQVVRKKTVDLSAGENTLKFINLSPFIDAQSIQVKSAGQLMILGVNHQQNFLDKSEKSEELKSLEKKHKEIQEKINIENALLTVTREDISFLQANKNIGGKNETLTVSNWQQTSDFYSKRLTALKIQELERSKNITQLQEEQVNIAKQIQTSTNVKDLASGEIIVNVNAKNAGKYDLEISYLVQNANWYPTYDIRAKDIDEPLLIVYKANIKQDTKEDWKNIKLKLSSNNPNVSNVAPELTPYILGTNVKPQTNNPYNNIVTGTVSDNQGPLPGVNIMVVGTTIGTETDFDGNYSITVPNQNTQLRFSYVGMETQSLPIKPSPMHVVMQQSANVLEEVVVTAFGVSREDSRAETERALNGKVAGVNVKKEKKPVQNIIIPTQQVENQTEVYFEIDRPYTVLSNNKKYSVDVAEYNINADYQYFAVPKINEETYLKANITQWEQYNLLAGEAQVFFEDAYVGKTLLDMRYVTDTLQISLGRDKKVTVKREKIKDFSSKQFLGSKKQESITWKTTLKNNKNKNISITILDQVPVSNQEDVKVEVQKTSGAKQNNETGEIKWEMILQPLEKKELELKYSVEYPKYKQIIVE